jgi:WD40 repeat protein
MGVKLWDTKTWELVRTLDGPLAIHAALAFAPNRELLAEGTITSVELWELGARSSHWRLAGWGPISFSPDGKLLASAGEDYGVHLWDPLTGKQLRVLPGSKRYVEALAFSPDGKLIAVSDGRVHLWDLESGKPKPIQPQLDERLSTKLTFSPDGKLLAIAQWSRQDSELRFEVNLWDVQTGKLARHLGTDTDCRSLVFAPIGATLAAAGGNGTVRLWDAATGRLVHSLKAEPEWNEALAFSPAGSILYSFDNSRRVQVWHVPSGQLLRTVPLQAR